MKRNLYVLSSVILISLLLTTCWSCKKDLGNEVDMSTWLPRYQSFTTKTLDVIVDENTTKIPIDVEFLRGVNVTNDFAISIVMYDVPELTTAIENEQYEFSWADEYIPTNPGYPEPIRRPFLTPFDQVYTPDIQKYELMVNGAKITEPVTVTLYCPQFQCWENPDKKSYIDTITINITPKM